MHRTRPRLVELVAVAHVLRQPPPLATRVALRPELLLLLRLLLATVVAAVDVRGARVRVPPPAAAALRVVSPVGFRRLAFGQELLPKVGVSHVDLLAVGNKGDLGEDRARTRREHARGRRLQQRLNVGLGEPAECAVVVESDVLSATPQHALDGAAVARRAVGPACRQSVQRRRGDWPVTVHGRTRRNGRVAAPLARRAPNVHGPFEAQLSVGALDELGLV